MSGTPDDSPGKPRDALIYILGRLGDEIKVCNEQVREMDKALAVAAEARATQNQKITDLEAAMRLLTKAVSERAVIDKERDKRVQRAETAAETVAAARWGAFGRLATTVQDCFRNPVVIAVGAGLASPLAITAAYLLARWLGIPVQALLGQAP